MPTLDQMKLEGPEVQDKIHKELYRIDQHMKAIGFGPMNAEELRYTFEKIKRAVTQILSSQKSQGPLRTPPLLNRPALPPPTQAFPPAPAVPMSAMAEGGDIADRSGRYTQEVRNRLGIR